MGKTCELHFAMDLPASVSNEMGMRLRVWDKDGWWERGWKTPVYLIISFLLFSFLVRSFVLILFPPLSFFIIQKWFLFAFHSFPQSIQCTFSKFSPLSLHSQILSFTSFVLSVCLTLFYFLLHPIPFISLSFHFIFHYVTSYMMEFRTWA